LPVKVEPLSSTLWEEEKATGGSKDTAPLPRALSGACESGECLTQRAWGSYRDTRCSLGAAGASGAADADTWGGFDTCGVGNYC